MRTARALAIGIIGLCTATAIGEPDPATLPATQPVISPPTVSLVEMSEVRYRSVDADNEALSNIEPRLNLLLEIGGPAVAGVTRAGRLTITHAADDAGNALAQAYGGDFGGEDFTEIAPYRRSGEGETSAFQAEIALAAPERSAKAIAALRGEITVLAGGERKTVRVDNLQDLLGNELKHPDFEKAGLKVTLKKPESDDPPTLALTIAGNLDAIESAAVLDADDNDLAFASSSFGSDREQEMLFELSGPITPQTRLVWNLAYGQEKLVIPFELTDIVLP